MDGDLQDPPRAIPHMAELLMESSADAPDGVRKNRQAIFLTNFRIIFFIDHFPG